MSDQDKSNTFIRETRTTAPGGSSMALIVGGLVVAVGFILWLVFGGPAPVATTEPASETTNVTITPSAPSADESTDTGTAPAPDVTEPAPAAPADGTGAAPAEDTAPADTAPATPPANP